MSASDRTGDEQLADLLARAADGEQAAFDALVDRYAGLVWRIALNHRLRPADAADVSQTVWLRLVEQLGRIREPERVGAWLATTTRHECLAVLRKGARTTPSEDATFEVSMPRTVLGGTAAGPEGSERLEVDERRAAVREAFAALDDRCRMLLALLHNDPPATYEEITVALDMPVGSIGPTRQRCLGKLRGHPAISRISGDGADPGAFRG